MLACPACVKSGDSGRQVQTDSVKQRDLLRHDEQVEDPGGGDGVKRDVPQEGDWH